MSNGVTAIEGPGRLRPSGPRLGSMPLPSFADLRALTQRPDILLASA
jgi:hypothetical protein